MNAPRSIHDAVSLLQAVQPAPLAHERLELRLLPPSRHLPTRRRFFRSAAELVAGSVQYSTTHHVFFGVGLRLGHNGTAAGVTRVGACWADIDAKLWADAPDPRRAACTAVERFAPQPGAVVETGAGFHVYWLLREPVTLTTTDDRCRLEALNAALARALCGPGRRPDHVHDVARILRLPGTCNPKYAPARPVTVVWCDPGRRYALASLEGTLGSRYPWAFPGAGPLPTSTPLRQPWPGASPTVLRTPVERGCIRPRTRRLLDVPGAAGYRSASEADAAVACALVGAGLTPTDALILLAGSARGRDAVRRKGERYAPRYLERTVARATEFVRTARGAATVTRAGAGPVARGPTMGGPVVAGQTPCTPSGLSMA